MPSLELLIVESESSYLGEVNYPYAKETFITGRKSPKVFDGIDTEFVKHLAIKYYTEQDSSEGKEFCSTKVDITKMLFSEKFVYTFPNYKSNYEYLFDMNDESIHNILSTHVLTRYGKRFNWMLKNPLL